MAKDINSSVGELSSKILLSSSEASELTGIGINRMRQLMNSKEFQPMIFYNGKKRMIKRQELEKYLLSRKFLNI